jgi:hypothetical protein
MKQSAWRADFFDNWDDAFPSRSVTISADTEEEAVDKAAALMGGAARIEFAPIIGDGRGTGWQRPSGLFYFFRPTVPPLISSQRGRSAEHWFTRRFGPFSLSHSILVRTIWTLRRFLKVV